MKTAWMALALVLTLARVGYADYRSVPVVYAIPNPSIELTKAELLDAQVYTEVKGNYENQMLKVVIGLDVVAWGNAPVTGVEVTSAQRSIDYVLNPTDTYYRVTRGAGSGISVGASRQQISFEQHYYLQQRPVSDVGKPWKAFQPTQLEPAKRYLNFDAGMLGGYNRWSLHELDYSQPTAVKLTFKKLYSYVQGQVLDH